MEFIEVLEKISSNDQNASQSSNDACSLYSPLCAGGKVYIMKNSQLKYLLPHITGRIGQMGCLPICVSTSIFDSIYNQISL